MKPTKICPQCQRKVSGTTGVCPWCHAELPQTDRKTWTDNRPYGLLSIIFSLVPVAGIVLGGFALSRNAGKQRIMGKVGITIGSLFLAAIVFFLILVLNMYLDDLKYYILHN